MIRSILFFSRKNCKYSATLKTELNKITHKLYHIESCNLKDTLDKKIIPKNIDYIVCFRSYFILDLEIINRAKHGAINFHPSLPKYRGVGGVNYALYSKDKYFGSTAHIIDEKIDNGDIIHVKRFIISKNDNLDSLLNKCHANMLKQALFIIKRIKMNNSFLKKQIETFKRYKWGKYKSLKQLNDFYEIKKSISKNELERKIKSTVVNDFKPFIKLHNRRFYLL